MYESKNTLAFFLISFLATAGLGDLLMSFDKIDDEVDSSLDSFLADTGSLLAGFTIIDATVFFDFEDCSKLRISCCGAFCCILQHLE